MDWKRIRAEYIAGGTSYRKLAEKYNVSFNTLKTRANEEQWYKLRQQKDYKTTTKLLDTLSDTEVEQAVNLFNIADLLAQKVMEIAATVTDPDSIKKLTSAIKDIRDIKGVKSDADMREQEARIRNLQRQAEAEDKTNNEITVIIEGDLEKYSK